MADNAHDNAEKFAQWAHNTLYGSSGATESAEAAQPEPKGADRKTNAEKFVEAVNEGLYGIPPAPEPGPRRPAPVPEAGAGKRKVPTPKQQFVEHMKQHFNLP